MGFENRSTRLLLVLNPRRDLERSKLTPPVPYPVYNDWRSSGSELLADSRVAPVRGK